MDNRFGVKDFVLVVLLLAVLGAVVLAMVQYDRQFDTMHAIQRTLQDQTKTLIQINQRLSRGVRLNDSGSANPAAAAGDTDAQADPNAPFQRWAAGHDNADYAPGGWYIDAFGQTVGKLTPLVAGDAYQAVIASHVIESLITRDPETLKFKPWIAKSWQVSDDGLTYTFQLRPGVVFSDGEPLTAKDVVFTYNWTMNPKVNAPRARAYLKRIQSVTANGEDEVVFKLKEPYFQALEICGGMGILAEHYYGKFTPEEFNSTPGLLFGSGPYKLSVDPEDWQPGSGQIQLVRNDRYWGSVKPALDRIIWKEISDETARLTAFRNGEVDHYGISPEQYDKLKRDQDLRAKANLYEYRSLAGGYRYVAWNERKNGQPTMFADVKVRKAMTLLANRQEMTRRIMAGLAEVATGPFNPLGNQADPDIEPWPYDPDRARALLKEAGYEDRDGDGVREGPDGKPMSFGLIYPAGSTNYQQMATYLKDAYARAGINMTPQPLEWTIMIQRINDRSFDAMTLGWGGTVESDPYQIFHSDSIAQGGDNYVSYKNAELDKLIDKARVTVDEEARNALWHKVHQILHADQPYTFLFYSKSVVYIDKRFKNIITTKVGISEPEEWYVPLAAQKYQ